MYGRYGAVSGPRGVAKLLIYICIDFILVANLLEYNVLPKSKIVYIVIYKLNELKKKIEAVGVSNANLVHYIRHNLS